MRKVSGSRKVNLLHIGIVFVVIGLGQSAPSGSDSEQSGASKVRHRSKRSGNLISILSNMLLEHSPANDWEDFFDFSNDEEYPMSNWNDLGYKIPTKPHENNFIQFNAHSDNVDSSKKFDSRPNYHYPAKGVKQDDYSFDISYQPSKSTLNKYWQSHNGGNYAYVHSGKDKPVQKTIHNYENDSYMNCKEMIPSRRITEIDEAVWKNIFKKPTYFGTSEHKASVYPSVRNNDFKSTNWIKTQSKHSLHKCIPDHSTGVFDTPIINEIDYKQVMSNEKDEYLVLLIKKDHFFEIERKDEKAETENQEPCKNQTEIVGKETPMLTTTESQDPPTQTEASTENTAYTASTKAQEEVDIQTSTAITLETIENTTDEDCEKDQMTATATRSVTDEVLSETTSNEIVGSEARQSNENETASQTTTIDCTTQFMKRSPIPFSTEPELVSKQSEENEIIPQTTKIDFTTEPMRQSSTSYSSTEAVPQTNTIDYRTEPIRQSSISYTSTEPDLGAMQSTENEDSQIMTLDYITESIGQSSFSYGFTEHKNKPVTESLRTSSTSDKYNEDQISLTSEYSSDLDDVSSSPTLN